MESMLVCGIFDLLFEEVATIFSITLDKAHSMEVVVGNNEATPSVQMAIFLMEKGWDWTSEFLRPVHLPVVLDISQHWHLIKRFNRCAPIH